MRLNSILILVLLSALLFVQCQDEDPVMTNEMMEEEMEEVEVQCGEERYNVDMFEDITVTTVKYAENLNFDGSEIQELFVDIYEPTGDEEVNRPLVIWAFGGSFVSGSRSDMASFATNLAKKGFVSACIDYRLLDILSVGIPDSLQALDIAIKATADMKAAVRFFRMDADTDNLFNIDPDNIYVGGLSAGAIVAIQTAVVNENDELASHVQQIIEANGGIDGDTGDETNRSYSSEVQGAISLSGAIYNLDWLNTSDPPLLAIHGDADETVAYDFGFANIFGQDIIPLYGGGAIADHALLIGHDTELVTIPGGGHTNIYISAEFIDQSVEFFDVVMKEYLIRGICQ